MRSHSKKSLGQQVNRFKSIIKRLRNKLKEKDEILSMILNDGHISYMVIDENGNIIRINNKCLEILGYTKKFIEDQHISSISNLDSKKLSSIISSIFKNRNTGKIIPFICDDNTIIKGNLTCISYQENNNAILLIDFIKDEEFEKELQHERYLLQVLMDNIPDTIYFKDKNSRFIRINKAQAELLGVDNPHDALGNTDFDYFTKTHAKKAYNDEQHILKTGESIVNKEEKLILKNKPTRWVSTTKVSIPNSEGKITQMVGISRNITARKHAEQKLKKALEKAKEADKLKSAFLANMSHEIRTPLNSILGFADLLLHPNLPEGKRTEFINIITSSGNMLLNLVNDIIDIAKIEAGQLNIIEKPLDINPFLQEIYLIYTEQMKGKASAKIRFALELPGDLHNPVISTDSTRLRQIITNLVNNAFKFTREGYIHVGYNYNKKTNNLDFYVEDTGIGIPGDKIGLIFKRFGRIISEKDMIDKGTGLGLAICKGLVELLGGKIGVETELNKGSIFRFSIPAKFVNVQQVSDNKKDIDLRLIDWSKKSVLIVEDDLYSFNYLKEALAPTNINIEFSESGEKAVDLIHSDKHFDIILMDLKLKGIDGYQTAELIGEINDKIPIIAQTAYALDNEENKTIEKGFDGYISKPIQLNSLLKLLIKFL